MSDEEIQKKILKILYDIWRDNPLEELDLGEIIQEGLLTATQDELYRNADYLEEKGFIRQQKTGTLKYGHCYAEVTGQGIDLIENKRLSSDVIIRRKILEVLRDASNYVAKEEIVRQTGFSDVEVIRNIKYLTDTGKAKAEWGTVGFFSAKITAAGIDNLKEPTFLEKQTIFMSNAYSILYKLENELRRFIEKKLREVYGEEWWPKGIPSGVRRKAEKKRAKEPDSSLSLLCYTLFSDLKRIIQKEENWHSIFRKYFRTLEVIISELHQLEDIRHTIAHTRLLSNEDSKKLNLFHKEITKTIARADESHSEASHANSESPKAFHPSP